MILTKAQQLDIINQAKSFGIDPKIFKVNIIEIKNIFWNDDNP